MLKNEKIAKNWSRNLNGQGTFNELLYKSIIKHSLPRRGTSSSLSRNKIGLHRVVAETTVSHVISKQVLNVEKRPLFDMSYM